MKAAGRFDSAVLMVTANHGGRWDVWPGDPRHVPLIVSRPGWPRVDVAREVRVQDVLGGLVDLARGAETATR